MADVYNPGANFRPRSRWGNRIDPINPDRNTNEFHSGQDFAAAAGTPIPSAATGKVVYSGFNSNLGNTVIIQNDAGGYSLYGHMQNGDLPKVGDVVWQGDTVGRVGSTGARTTGNHLHYSVIKKEPGQNIPQTDKGGPLHINLNRYTTEDPAGYTKYRAQIPYLDQTQAAEQTLGVASSLRPGNAPNVLPNIGNGMMSGTPPKYPAIPYVDQTNAAQRALDNSLPVGTQPQGAPPWALSDRFGSWNTIDGASAPAPPPSRRGSDEGFASPTQFAGNAPASMGAPAANPSPVLAASSSPSINPLLAATAAYPSTGGGFSYASTLQGLAHFIGNYMMPSPSPVMSADRPPFAGLQSGLGTIGPNSGAPVPLLTPREQDPLGGGMSGWGASVTGPNAASTAVPPNAANGGSNVPWRPASVFPTVAPPVSYPPPTLPMKTGSYGYMLALAAGLDPEHPDEPPPGGIPGRILEWMRNNPDGVADG